MKTRIIVLFIVAIMAQLILATCQKRGNVHETSGNDDHNGFTFFFLTDIHITPDKSAPEAFDMLIDTVNALDPDFIITGGDLIMDALGQSYDTSKALYDLYTEKISGFKMPVYNTMGNHEVFGLYRSDSSIVNHPEYNEKMYEKRLGAKHFSFEHKGWKFIILDAIGQTDQKKYFGFIDSMQIGWIQKELEKTDKDKPIAISVHIPFITTFTQLFYGSLVANKEGIVITNAKEVLSLFKDHNLKLVLQGHLHIFEDIFVNEIRFITGGAVSGAWWNGANHGTEEGFVSISIKGESISAEYIDYGWEID